MRAWLNLFENVTVTKVTLEAGEPSDLNYRFNAYLSDHSSLTVYVQVVDGVLDIVDIHTFAQPGTDTFSVRTKHKQEIYSIGKKIGPIEVRKILRSILERVRQDTKVTAIEGSRITGARAFNPSRSRTKMSISEAERAPIIAYHGTNQPFETFDLKRGGMATGENAGATHAIFFTSDPAEAAQYAEHAGRRVVSNISNFERETERLRKETERLERLAHRTGNWKPYEQAMLAWEEFELGSIREDPSVGARVIKAKLRLNNPLEVSFLDKSLLLNDITEEAVLRAKKEGHDGVIFHDIEDSPLGGIVSTHYAVFDPDQITILD